LEGFYGAVGVGKGKEGWFGGGRNKKFNL